MKVCMKIGDRIWSTKIRPGDTATVVKADVEIKKREGKSSQVQSRYTARYLDGSEITFYGFNINKSIFKRMDPDGQYTLFDYMGLN